MDWEKKTTQREKLLGSAADSFNDQKTPGQALLGSLQASEAVRKDNYYNTVDAKMKAAREQLPALEPHHPKKSDMAIFGQPPAEASGLLTSVPPGTVSGGSNKQKTIKEHNPLTEQLVGPACHV
jgi:hypothetical protein